MYGRFANSEFLSGAPHRCLIFDDIKSQLCGPFLDVTFQVQHSPPRGGLSYAKIWLVMKVEADMKSQPRKAVQGIPARGREKLQVAEETV
jgi:hypothetical protein